MNTDAKDENYVLSLSSFDFVRRTEIQLEW